MAEEYDDAFHYDWLTKRWSKVLGNASNQYAEHLFPLSVVGAGGWDLPNWVQGYEKFWGEKAKAASDAGDTAADQFAHHAENAKTFGEHLKGITEQYQISYIELDQDLGVDKVCDIFRSTAAAFAWMRSTSLTRSSSRRVSSSNTSGAVPPRAWSS